MTRATEIIGEIQNDELEALRAERDQALSDLQSSKRECEILRGLTPGVGVRIGKFARSDDDQRRPIVFDDPRDERMAMLEHAVRTLDAALYDIAYRHGDCYSYGRGVDNEKCDCPVCLAREALKLAENWRHGGSKEKPQNRYAGSFYERTSNGFWPREAKIHAAWSSAVDDFMLADILKDRRPAPSARDWYVATSVVQWLATAVGMAKVLEKAGFEYQHFAEDAAEESRRRRERIDRETAATTATL